MSKRDYYEILGVSKTASKEEIKIAYKKLAKQYHPDINKEASAAERFKEISEAYAVLNDDQKRAQYDQFGHAGFDQRYSQEDIFRDFDFNVFRDFGFGGFDSIFDTFFGRQGQRRSRGVDLQYNLKLTFEEAAFGVEKTLEIPRHESCSSCDGTGSTDKSRASCSTCMGRGQVQKTHRTAFGVFTQIQPCDTCNGSGYTVTHPCKACKGKGIVKTTKEISVNIPAGVNNGNQIRLKEQGDLSEDQTAGDLYVVVHVLPHELFTREAFDLYLDYPLSFTQATLGATIDVPTLDGTTSLKIPSGTPSHHVFRLKGFGIQHLQASGKGDLYVRVLLTVPEKLTKKQRELLEQFAKEFGEDAKKKGFFR